MSTAEIAWHTPRSVVLERWGYSLAAPVLAIAPNVAPDGAVNSAVLLAGAAATAFAVAKWGKDNAGRALVRCSPGIAALGIDIAAQYTAGWGWDALMAAGWGALGMALSPLARTSRKGRAALPYVAAPTLTAAPAAQPTPATPEPELADDFTRGVRALWERAGLPGRTVVVHVEPHEGTRHDFTMLLRACEEGRPITGLRPDDVAAAFGIEETDVQLCPVSRTAGRQCGPGWLEVHVTPDACERRRQDPSDIERWADKVARDKGGAPGSVLVSKKRDDQRGVTFYRARMEDPAATPRLDLPKICGALGIAYDDARVRPRVEGSQFLISVFDQPPLLRIFPATRELLTPDAKGMYVCGFSEEGQPVKNMVFQHDKNAACHGLILGVTRSGKTQYFAISMAAESLAGGVEWLASYRRDEKTSALGEFIDRQGASPLYMLRMLRAAKALCDIRAEMPWEYDGKPHDYKPGDARCPYRPLNVYADEFMTATGHPEYGEEIQALADDLTVMGLKYGIGLKVAGQSPFAHNGFSTEMKDNLRQNSRPVIFNMGSPAATRKAAEGTVENPSEVPTVPARYACDEGDALDRIMSGEAAPENGVSTGGVAVIVLDNGRAVLMRSLYADFDTDLSQLFPAEIARLTEHEIHELEQQDLWGDWYRPEPKKTKVKAKNEDDLDLDDEDDWDPAEVTSPRQALDLIKSLSS